MYFNQTLKQMPEM